MLTQKGIVSTSDSMCAKAHDMFRCFLRLGQMPPCSTGLIYPWSALYATGYLTDAARPEGGRHKLVIPNMEVRRIYETKIGSARRSKETTHRNCTM